jgi:hypothetical protein
MLVSFTSPQKRILNRHAAEFPAVLQVFSEQPAATRIGGGRGNECIVDTELPRANFTA